MSDSGVVRNGFRRPKDRILSRYQLTAVMDETAPAVIQHAHLITSIQDKIREHETALDLLEKKVVAMSSIKTRYRLHRVCGCSWWLSLWRAL